MAAFFLLTYMSKFNYAVVVASAAGVAAGSAAGTAGVTTSGVAAGVGVTGVVSSIKKIYFCYVNY
ncbi:hypothetical protein KW798_02610 [Candidatus Parcubacteria bacterium]|nr:hypothetical protein [Candidatus Parcubacteria bacterium]